MIDVRLIILYCNVVENNGYIATNLSAGRAKKTKHIFLPCQIIVRKQSSITYVTQQLDIILSL